MDTVESIRNRRSVKRFEERIPSREEVEALLEVAILAPNHRMTEPWSFRVLGPEARQAYGAALGARRAAKVTDPEAAEAVREKAISSALDVPLMIGVVQRLDADPEIREEDYAACFMGIQNLCLAAVERGLGTHVKTGAVLADPPLREALEVGEAERLVALLNLGDPAELPAAKSRQPALRRTVWLR